MAGDAQGLFGFLDLVQQRQTLCLEFGDGDFFNDYFIRP
jgi:hypothetical protein